MQAIRESSRRMRTAPLVCHPERSEAESKDLGTAPTQGRISSARAARTKPICRTSANPHRAPVGADIIRPRSAYQTHMPRFGESAPHSAQGATTPAPLCRMPAGTRRDVGIAPYRVRRIPIVGVGVPDDPCRTPRRVCNSRANPHRAQRRGGYHPPAQRVPNPHAALRRIRSAFRVGGDDPGAPLSDACRNPARCGHRALQGAANPHRRGRRPRRPVQNAPIIMPTPGESAPRPT